MNAVGVLAEIFVAAMAVFGLWCAFELLMLDLSVTSDIVCALEIKNQDDIDALEETLCALDQSAYFRGKKRYVFLLSEESAADLLKSDISEELFYRAEFYIREEIKKKE